MLDNPENGRVEVTGQTVGNVATYGCDVGFELVGVDTRLCEDSGRWGGVAPTSEPEALMDILPPGILTQCISACYI